MTKKDTGGPAFPVTLFEGQTLNDGTANGMTLRDYIAIHASDRDIDQYIETGEMEEYTFYVSGIECESLRPILRSREQARYCYADAMLIQRNKND